VTDADLAAANPAAAPAPGPAEAALSPLAQEVLRFANRVHNVLKRAERPELAERVRHEAGRWKDDATNVVITGDIKRGKSSLINALVGSPDLLPVDADVATCVHLLVRYADEPCATVTRAVDDDRTETLPIARGDLVDYASMAGDPAKRAGVLRVDVGVPSPLLERGLTLVDTPGVGGMTRGHTDVTLSTLGLADALLFAVSAQEPILRSELQFLLEASQRVDTVIFVVTKADATPHIEAMVAENREKIATFVTGLRAADADGESGITTAEQASRLERLSAAPFVPVSAKLAIAAQAREAAGRGERAAEMRSRSGLPRLERFLDATLQAREDVRLSNILQVADATLSHLASDLETRSRAARGDGALDEELRREQAALDELANRQARWRQKLGVRVQRLQAELNQAVSREQSRIERVYRAQLDAAGSAVTPLLDRLPADLAATVQASWADLTRFLAQGMNEALAEVVHDLELADVDLVMSDLVMPDRVQEIADARQALANAKALNVVEDGVPGLMQAFIFGNLLGIVVPGVGHVLGGAVSLGVVKLRKRVKVNQVSKSEYQRIVREAAGGLAQEFRAESALRIVEARSGIEQLVDDRIRLRKGETEARRRELANQLKQETSGRQRAEEQLRSLSESVAELRQELDRLRDRVYAALERR
jgi:hypothetical protein